MQKILPSKLTSYMCDLGQVAFTSESDWWSEHSDLVSIIVVIKNDKRVTQESDCNCSCFVTPATSVPSGTLPVSLFFPRHEISPIL